MIIKKPVYEASVASLLKSLSSVEGVDDLVKSLLAYRSKLKNSDKLSEEQTLALASAKTLLEAEKTKVVEWLGLEAWNAIAPSASGTEVQQAKALAQALGGDSAAMVNAFILDNALTLLSLPDNLDKHFSNGVLALGTKKSTSGGGGSNDRPSLTSIDAGDNFWYRYSSTWYQIVGTSTGIRLFNLSTRVEITDKNNLPTHSSACQKMICIGSDGKPWAAAFRGYVSSCPEGIVQLTDEELLA